ncbi:MAG: DUF177 domain-containing protein [Alphaproteobacteria bacterium]|nr:DUF177 domain-containing protein [Alphaproteobacteria bacterium]
MSDKTHVNEFSRIVEVEKIAPRGGHSMSITAEPAERVAVAKRLGLLELDSLIANLTVERAADGVSFTADGTFDADVVQECVVSLTPLSAKLHDIVAGHFVPPQRLSMTGEPEEIENPLAEIPEPIIDGTIDLGELVVQHLALALDPYPRQPGVEPVLPRTVAPVADTQKPFAGLATLLKTKEKSDKKE